LNLLDLLLFLEVENMELVVNSLSFKSEIRNINLVEKLIDDISVTYSISSDIYGKILLAVVEGVNNAIVHGNRLNKEKMVNVDYSLEDELIEFTITDQGKGFDFSHVPDPTKPENLEKSHGRGIFLMNHLADEIEFLENGCKVKLVFKLSCGS
jgi:serine/threonine-protein kinase RsbW